MTIREIVRDLNESQFITLLDAVSERLADNERDHPYVRATQAAMELVVACANGPASGAASELPDVIDGVRAAIEGLE